MWNRIYLIGSLLVSFVLPFVIYPESAPSIPTIYAIDAAVVDIVQVQQQQPFFNLATSLWSLYVLGVLIMSYRFYKQLIQLKGFLNEGEEIELEDCSVILINSNHIGSFSFLKWIVVNRSDYENHFDAILRHEMVHMQQKHSMDVLLIELLKIVFWFNPILLLYKKSLQEVHEFLADSAAPNKDHYATFLVSYALNAPIATLTNHFFKPSQIKTRIQMIYKNRTSKWLLASYVMILGTIGLVALGIAGCERSESQDNIIFSAVEDSSQTKRIFTVVEEQPEFPGGTTEMYKFLGQNIRYPVQASKANVSGSVFLSFVISETGKVSDITVLKGIGYGCDAEAIRVIKLFPTWKPAKQDGVPVNVRYTLPINFQLEDAGTSMLNNDQELQQASERPNSVHAELLANGEWKFSNTLHTNQLAQADASPLLIINNKIEKDKEVLKKIKADNITSMAVFTDKDATDAYGEDGKNGVFVITTK
jgi:TonB family protein